MIFLKINRWIANTRNGYYSVTILLLVITLYACRQSGYQPPEDPLFIKLSPAQTGIDFRNDLIDDSVFNETTYRNFYNGGGVAAGDINNDGLTDIFITSNQGPNKLYLNKGGLKFEDITAKSGIVKHHGWSNGVTMADVNADGFLDIYVSVAGKTPGDKRKNELYINKGNLQFEELADKYNLTDEGSYHTQAAFFDYDLDGDLDVYLLNNDGNVPVTSFPDATYPRFRSMNRSEGGDKLMQNNNGVYTDVSDEAGIYSVKFGFGLGITIGDINGDMYPDIYISNDFFEKDYLYINRRDGTFAEMSDSALGHMSQSSMGADIADINNDGLMDIFSTDMLPENDYRLKKNTRFDDYDIYKLRNQKGYHYQLLSNMLHLNNGNNTFSEIAQYAGVNATDWSWGALIFDLNSDGWKDIVVCNGMYLDVTDNDYIDFLADENRSVLNRQGTNVTSYKLLKQMTVSTPIPNYAFVNNKNISFTNDAYKLGLGEPGFSNGAIYADLDNDGDMDVFMNNLNSPSALYKNNTMERQKKNYLPVKLKGLDGNTFGIGATVTIFCNGTTQSLQNFPTRGFQSAIEPVFNFGLDYTATIDSLIVLWPNLKMQKLYNVASNKTIILNQADATIPFLFENPLEKKNHLFTDVTTQKINGNILHKENLFVDFNRERLMPHLLSTQGPAIAKGDVNGDGLEDFVVGGAKHDTTKLFMQTKNKTFKQVAQPIFANDENYEDTGMELFDADYDGDLDLLIASGGNLDMPGSPLLRPRLYLNNGKGLFTKDETRLPHISLNASCISVYDFDGDGYKDVFIGGRSVPGQYGVIPNSYLLKNIKGVFEDVTDRVAPQLKNIGMVTDAVWMDADNDALNDLVVVGEWMPVTIFRNNKKQLKLSEINSEFSKTHGWWNCIESADMDNDGDIDFIAGNQGLNTKIKADSLHPAELYINDYDKNGTAECVLTYYKSDGKSYPYYLRNDLTAQLPALKKKFLKHEQYSAKTIEQVFGKQQLQASQHRQAYLFKSCLFINDGKGKFSITPLPDVAQLSPVYAIVVKDIDSDNISDILLSGNFYGLKPELGRYDASYGVFLKDNKNGSFTAVPALETGLCSKGEVRDVKYIAGTGIVVIAKSNGALQLYSTK